MSIPHADDPLGYDVKIGSDLDPSGRPSWGAELVADALLHRLQADTLLMTEAPSGEIDFGIDLARKLAGATSAADLLTLGPQIEEVLRREKRVASVSVVLSTTTGAHAAQYRLLVAVAARLVTGETLERVVGVNSVSVEFLAAGR